MRKLTMQTNGNWDRILLDGKEIMSDDGINLNELLYRLSNELKFDYELVYGEFRDGVYGKFYPEED